MRIHDVLFKVSTIRNMWQAGHHQEIKHENVNFIKVCKDIEKHTKKFPLSTSSILINGAARTYSAELDELLIGLIKLDNDLIKRNERKPFVETLNPESSTTSRLMPVSPDITPSTMPNSTKYSESTTISASTPISASVLESATSRAASSPNTGSLGPQSEYGSESGSASQLQSASEDTSSSIVGPDSISEPESPRLDQTDPENDSDCEVSPTYTGSSSMSTYRHNLLRVPALSTIFEESSMIESIILTDGAERIDEGTQSSLRPSEFVDENLPFGSLRMYGACQCNPKIPCAIVCSSVEFE